MFLTDVSIATQYLTTPTRSFPSHHMSKEHWCYFVASRPPKT